MRGSTCNTNPCTEPSPLYCSTSCLALDVGRVLPFARPLRYWVLPDGRAVVWSLLELVSKRTDELIDPNAIEAYHAVGQQLGCLPLGMLPDEERGA